MHTIFLILKYRPHLELEWFCATIGLSLLAAITLDATTIIVAIIGLISTTLTLYFSYLMAKNTKSLEATNVKVDEYHSSVNSKMDKLILSIETAALAKGHLAGVESEKIRRTTQEADIEKGRKESQTGASPAPSSPLAKPLKAEVEITKMPNDKTTLE